ncbi:hypothetical protein POX_a01312 [Penicillium oxalicum]|uniref:Uncharacterized protein n=1 Tax=Penicillium oxalicum (strain 114-2 / CGMCC 5302) TaxID=933388 RepID=S7ZTC8_PENO1|nr:hypothetical protein POX_a01312 [Penicillium oxalicum]EPS33694.1 hypothetical protein PDE_08656 [Penicillium oxalicum 114-2]KAI2794711.1 hypothetical protein POX_a01312 [Penicillium oxalicum]
MAQAQCSSNRRRCFLDSNTGTTGSIDLQQWTGRVMSGTFQRQEAANVTGE